MQNIIKNQKVLYFKLIIVFFKKNVSVYIELLYN